MLSILLYSLYSIIVREVMRTIITEDLNCRAHEKRLRIVARNEEISTSLTCTVNGELQFFNLLPNAAMYVQRTVL